MTPSDSHASRRAFYRPELDVLRFGAFLMVFLCHVFPAIPGPYLAFVGPTAAGVLAATVEALSYGLCLFFFLSAYLITSLLLLEIESTGRLHLGDFYLRRILRIWPLYSLGLLILLTVSLLRGEPLTMFFYYLCVCGNWFYLEHPWSFNPMTPLWSISVEEQFYLFLPCLMLLIKDGSRLLVAAVIIFLLSLGCVYYLGSQHAELGKNVSVNTGTQAIFFAAGIGSAVLTSRRDFHLGNVHRVLLAVGSWTCLFLSAYVFEAKRAGLATNGWSVTAGYFLTAVGCTGLMFSLLNCSWPFPKWLIYLGKISYGLYVFHLLALEMVIFLFIHLHVGYLWTKFGFIPGSPLALLITIGLAALSYRYLERPFLRLRHRFTFVPNRPD